MGELHDIGRPSHARLLYQCSLGRNHYPEQQGFQLAVPYQPGIAGLRVAKAGRVLGELVVRGGSTEMALALRAARIERGMLNADWSAAPGLSYLVRLSDDGGKTWRIVALDLKSPDLRLPVSPGASAEFRPEVLASDGIHTERLQVDLPEPTNEPGPIPLGSWVPLSLVGQHA